MVVRMVMKERQEEDRKLLDDKCTGLYGGKVSRCRQKTNGRPDLLLSDCY